MPAYRRTCAGCGSNIQALAKKKFVCTGFALDVEEKIVRRGAEIIPLVAMESRLLAYFMQHPRAYFCAAELYKAIWGKESFGDNRTVTVHIYNLRQKLEADPANPQYLKKVWGKGYYFDPDGQEGAEG